MRLTPWLPLLLIGLQACTLPLVGDITPPITAEQREQAEQRNAEAVAQEKAKRAAMDRIIVLGGDSARPYRVLGLVRGEPELLVEQCSTELIREVAFEQFPNVDAVIGFTVLRNLPVGGDAACEGTAIVFIDAK